LPNKKQLPFNKAFIRSLPRLAVERDGDSRIAQYLQDPNVAEYLPESGFFITIKTRITGARDPRGPRETKKFKLWWKSVENSQTVVAKVLSLGTKVKFVNGDIEASEPFDTNQIGFELV